MLQRSVVIQGQIASKLGIANGRPRNLVSLQRGLAASTFAAPVEPRKKEKERRKKSKKKKKKAKAHFKTKVSKEVFFYFVQVTSSSALAVNSTLGLHEILSVANPFLQCAFISEMPSGFGQMISI